MRQRNLYEVAAAVVSVLAIAGLLWFASPVADTAVTASNEGLLYNNTGEYHKAIAAFTRAIELDPNFALSYSNVGLVYKKFGHYEKAFADCTTAIELDPSLAIAYNNRSCAYIELGQYEQAITDYTEAIQLDPNLQKTNGG